MRLHRRPSLPVLTAAVLLATALVAAACSSDEAERGEASGRVASATWDPEQVVALPAVVGNGPPAPEFDGSVLDGTFGLSTSLTPTLRVAPGTWTGGPVAFELTTLDGAPVLEAPGEGDPPSVRVPPGRLRDQRAYRLRISGAVDPPVDQVVTVDVVRAAVAPVLDWGGVQVNRFNGEVGFQWSPPGPRSITGPANVSLSYRPSRSSTAGLPAGWAVEASGSRWSRVVDNGDGSLTVEGTSSAITYRLDGEVWRAVWGDGRSWPTGQYADLQTLADGGLALVEGETRTTFTAPAPDRPGTVASVWTKGTPTFTQRWDDGRLVALEDPASGDPATRTVQLVHAPDERCAGAGGGFVDAPTGSLCAIVDWAGRTARLRYVADPDGPGPLGPTIGRLVTSSGTGAAAQVTDLAWDAAGRLAAVRSPLATAAVAAGVRAPGDDLTTQLTYDAVGRVERVVLPAPGGASDLRATRVLRYAVGDDGRVVSEVVDPASTAPWVTRIVGDSSTWQTLEQFAAPGRNPVRLTWKRSNDALEETIDERGLRTVNSYDDLGRIVGRTGPVAVVDPSAPPETTTLLDQTFERVASGEPMVGLAVTYWRGEGTVGTPATADWGPRVDSSGWVPASYEFDLDPPEEVRDGDRWTATLTGVLRLPRRAAWTVAAPAGRLVVDDRVCPPEGGCTVDGSRPVRIRLQVAGDLDGALVGITAAADGAPPAPVDSAWLAPDLQRATTTEYREQVRAGGPNLLVRSRTDWADPVAGVVGSTALVTERGTLASGSAIESTAWEPDRDEFGQVVARTTAGGSRYTSGYHPTVGDVERPCGFGPAPQLGLAAELVEPGPDGGPGLRHEQFVDAVGMVSAARTGDGPWTCTERDAAGRVVRTWTGDPESPISWTTNTYEAGGSPFVTRTTTGSPGTERSSEVVVDLLGRTVTSVDLLGIRTAWSYDPNVPDRPVAVTLSPPGGATSTTTFRYDDQGSLVETVLDGRPVSVGVFDRATGVQQAVSLGNGTSIAYRYDGRGIPDQRTFTTPSGTWVETVRQGSQGRVLGTRLEAPGVLPDADWSYAYDPDTLRLRSAEVQTTAPVTANRWDYEWDPNGNLLTQRILTAAAGEQVVRAEYDGGDRLVRSTLPGLEGSVAEGSIVYDSQDRITRIGDLDVTYTATGSVESVTDRTAGTAASGSTATSAVRILRVGSEVVGRTLVVGGQERAIYAGSGGFVLDGLGPQARVLARQFTVAPGVVATISGPGPAAEQWSYAGLSGDPWFATDGAGAVSATGVQLHDPYGQPITPPVPPAADGVPVPGHGSAEDLRIGRVAAQVFGPRLYLPGLGRFSSPDPQVGSSQGRYTFADLDPVNGSDPSGRSTAWYADWRFWLGTVAAIAIGAGAAVLAAKAGTAIGAALAGVTTKTEAVVWATAAGAVIGASGGALAGVAGSAISSGSVDWTAVWVGAVVGAVTGGYSAGAAGAKAWQTTTTKQILDDLASQEYHAFNPDSTQTAHQWYGNGARGRSFEWANGKGIDRFQAHDMRFQYDNALDFNFDVDLEQFSMRTLQLRNSVVQEIDQSQLGSFSSNSVRTSQMPSLIMD